MFLLAVAGQPAVQVYIFFAMTLDTFSHTPFLVGQSMLIFNLAMAVVAGYLVVDVALMVEYYMLGNIVDLNPRRRCPGVEILVFF